MTWTESNIHLPTECWELIFNRLETYHDLEDLSLVCKPFLFIANSIRRTLKIFGGENNPSLPNLLKRFPNLKSIDLDLFTGNLNRILSEIEVSGLNLETLNISRYHSIPIMAFSKLGSNMENSLKVLICCEMGNLHDMDLMVIANSMPGLEELDISKPVNKNCGGDDENCPLLRVVMMSHTDLGTEGAIGMELVQNENVKFLGLSNLGNFIDDESLDLFRFVCPSVKIVYGIGVEAADIRRGTKEMDRSRCWHRALTRGDVDAHPIM
ncbi:F-box/LRR-repeat protein [Quillaja saponaria]|uniref:F-box/LRR-repeat protein n=1 Tax=Quillaja saponaria TaxID=32244 RepID=A0AAD7Q5C4_QUISA|nr:F-box/LRR-repeat protein [Quillaja saponaria]